MKLQVSWQRRDNSSVANRNANNNARILRRVAHRPRDTPLYTLLNYLQAQLTMLMTNSPARLTVNTATCPHQWLVLPRPTLRLARSRRRLPVTATSSVQPAEGDPPRARNRRRAPGSNQAPQRRTPRTPPDNKPASNNPSKGLRKVEYKGPMSNVARVVLSRQSPAIARLLREVVADIKVGHHKNRTEQAALTDSLHRILDAVPMLALESVPGVVWVTGVLFLWLVKCIHIASTHQQVLLEAHLFHRQAGDGASVDNSESTSAGSVRLNGDL